MKIESKKRTVLISAAVCMIILTVAVAVISVVAIRNNRSKNTPKQTFGVYLPENLKNDTQALNIQNQITKDFSVAGNYKDESINDSVVSSIIAKTEITIIGFDDKKCDLNIKSVDLSVLTESIADLIPEGLNSKEIQKRTLQIALDKITGGDYKTIERLVSVPLINTAEGIKLDYDFVFINAVYGGAFDRFLSEG
jgi:hypothetical protein